MLLDDVGAILPVGFGGNVGWERGIAFDWLNLVWQNKREWLNVTREYKNMLHLKSEVRQNIVD